MFDRITAVLSSALFILLLGCSLLFIAYWNLDAVPTWVSIFNTVVVLLLLVGVGATLLASNANRVDQFYRFCSSGLFFLALGLGFLFIAHLSMGTAHAGISFVLVVLGVALLLYGTGTQGMGELKAGSSAAKYNVVIAGGAGVLAFCVALGIIWYSPEMRDAFQTERKFVRLLIKSADGLSNIPSYAPTFEIDGVAIPAARRGNFVEVYVPYVSSELARTARAPEKPKPAAVGANTVATLDDQVCKDPENQVALAKISNDAIIKTISAVFYRIDAKETLKPQAPSSFYIRLDQSMFDRRGGGADYPIYPVQMCINLQATESANTVISKAGNNLTAAPGRDEPLNIPSNILYQLGVQ